MILFNVKIDGLTQLLGLLDNIIDVTKKPFENQAAGYRDAVIKIIRQNFRDQGRRVGGWPPLTPAYAARKAEKYPGRPLLIASGKMHKALTSTAGRSGMILFRQLDDWISMGVLDPKYTGFHQKGTRRGLPARPLFVVDKDFGEDVAHKIVDDMFDTVKRLGRIF